MIGRVALAWLGGAVGGFIGQQAELTGQLLIFLGYEGLCQGVVPGLEEGCVGFEEEEAASDGGGGLGECIREGAGWLSGIVGVVLEDPTGGGLGEEKGIGCGELDHGVGGDGIGGGDQAIFGEAICEELGFLDGLADYGDADGGVLEEVECGVELQGVVGLDEEGGVGAGGGDGGGDVGVAIGVRKGAAGHEVESAGDEFVCERAVACQEPFDVFNAEC